jgi:hypothetical protein
MYVFEPMNTLLYAVPLKLTGNVNELGADHEIATWALPAVPETLVGMAEALTTVGVAETTNTVAKSVDETRANAKEPRNTLLQYLVTFANTKEVYLENLSY